MKKLVPASVKRRLLRRSRRFTIQSISPNSQTMLSGRTNRKGSRESKLK
jgi:hypothetical protein